MELLKSTGRILWIILLVFVCLALTVVEFHEFFLSLTLALFNLGGTIGANL